MFTRLSCIAVGRTSAEKGKGKSWGESGAKKLEEFQQDIVGEDFNIRAAFVAIHRHLD
jgi:hypothetical protein